MGRLEENSPYRHGLSNEGVPVDVAGVLKLVLLYAGFSAVYILLSDQAVSWMFSDPEQVMQVSIAKGWIFVAVTSALLYGLIHRLLRQGLEALQEREQGYHDLAEQSPAIIYQASLDGESKTTYISPRVSVLGYSPREWIDTPNLWLTLIHPDDVERVLAELERSHVGKTTFSATYRLQTRQGEWRHFHDEARVVHDAHGHALFLQGMMLDITDRKRAEDSYKTLFQMVGQGIVYQSADGRIISANPAAERIFGLPLDQMLGRRSINLILGAVHADGSPFPGELHPAMVAVRTGKSASDVVMGIKNPKSEQIVWINVNATPIFKAGTDQVEYTYSTFEDITEKKQNEALIWQQANFDGLTGLLNRRMVQDRLDLEIKKSDRTGLPLALLFIDLDRFKEVNDALGHELGDDLLKEAARRMLNCVRSEDSIGRLGGDEFTIILGGLDGVDSIGRVASDMLGTLSAPFQLGGELVYISASIGITIYPNDAKDAATLLKNADQAMYAAKRQGRNCFHYYTPVMQALADTRARITNDLHAALADNQLRVYYQPIVEFKTGRIQKAEALIRWQHPKMGLVSPADFIPIAEETGQIVEIGDWVFRQAVALTVRLRANSHPDFQISVNKSPMQFRTDSDDHTPWFDHMRQEGLPGHGIVVEITEGLLMEAREEISSQLLRLRDHGMQVALDDFGTGYSSLSYLKKFDIDYIKIDQSFVCNLTHGSNDLALCEAMIVMAHKLNLKVIAEGVETQEQSNLLKQIGCDYGQGYLWSRPLPVDEFERLLKVG